jgi:uncharacterized protein YndB with AHSA1/START domain
VTVVDTIRDPENRTFTVVAEFTAPPPAVWQLWADPRKLERWWGPPSWPATFREHAFVVGGSAAYHMTGPDGERANGWWRFRRLDEPKYLELEDGFADQQGQPDPSLPTTVARVNLEEIPTGTRMTITSQFTTLEQMEQVIAMGMIEGVKQALSQIDGILAEG